MVMCRESLVDIGGFLGMGARSVAIDMSQMHFLRDEDGARFAAVTSSREPTLPSLITPTSQWSLPDARYP